MKEFDINAKFYNPDSFEDLKEKISNKTKMILVENPGSNTFEFQDLSKIVQLAKEKNIYTLLDNTWGTPLYLKPLKNRFRYVFLLSYKIFFRTLRCYGGILSGK